MTTPHDERRDTTSDVAVIGIACRFPGADDPERFWQNLREGVESISALTDEELAAAGVPKAVYGAPDYVKAHGVIEGIELFDAAFFGYAPREAEVIDPQQRLFLECAWEALERAGYDPARYPGAVGVFGGATLSSYLLRLNPHLDRLRALGVDTTMLALGNDKDTLSPRVAYKLDLRGPAVSVQTACSSSLVAVHMACQSLLAGESDMALAGGVSLTVPMKVGYAHQEGGILSPDGHCRAFDARAGGTVFGCGAGVVLLKRLDEALADGDHVHAVVRGTAVNNDGASKVGFTAPSVAGQAEVIAEALANAGLEAEDVGYVEAHGTATALGDPVEVAALTRAFRRTTGRTGFCALGSVKTNIGHLEAAAGIAGFIKAVLAVERREIPPSLHFERPNREIDFAATPFFVNAALGPWPEGPRRAGVSSFGFGGTNAHAVLEEAPAPAAAGAGRPWRLLVLSGRTPRALAAATAGLAERLERDPFLDLDDAAYTLQVGRRPFEHRRAVACRDAADALSALADPTRVASGAWDGTDRQVAFLFPGQGAQHPGMARELYREEEVFRRELDACAELFRQHLEMDLRAFVDVEPAAPEAAELGATLERTEVAQPALFAVEYALARLWQSWGVVPKAMLGHSVGEMTAACLAGVFSLADAVALVAARGRLMAALPPGDMLAVPMGEAELAPLLAADLALAAVHGPEMCVVSGPAEAVDRLLAELEARGVESRKLHTSHAFHSPMMDPVVEPFVAEVRKVRLSPPRIPFASGLTGRLITPAEATDPRYWGLHLRRTTRLAEGLATLLAKPGAVLLEVGPAQALAGAARQHPARKPAHAVLPSLPHPKDPRDAMGTVLQALGGLWVAGVEVDWPALHAARPRRRVPLPTYPFERQRCWLEVEAPGAPAAVDARGEDARTAERRAEGAPFAATRPVLEVASPATQVASPATGVASPAMQAASPATAAPAPPAAPPVPAAAAFVASRYEFDEQGGAFVAPRNEVEEVLADMWRTLLGVERVGVEDNFFRLNGNSLIALQAISRIQSLFGVKLAVRTFFESPTVAALARVIAERQPGQDQMAARARILAEVMEVVELAKAAPTGTPPAPQAVETPAAACPMAADGDDAMRFSLFFFSGDEAMFPQYKYQLVVEAAKFADRHGFTAVWTPERHFHSFGGLYPSPSVLASALAMVTERIALRAGSVVLPLHHPIRVAEEWSIVDNLSRGRVGLSFASGFHPSDFTFAPEAYGRRRDVMFEKIATLRRLWRGEPVTVTGGAGDEIAVEIFPKPVQRELPIWVTCANSRDTFERTGEIGANVLTSLIGLTTDILAERIAAYRDSRARHGLDPATGQVAVMLHTFIGTDLAAVKEKARRPFCNYLRSHTELLTSLAKSLNRGFEAESIASEDLDELIEMEFERYFRSGSLLGTPESCLDMVRRLRAIGVDEVGCLLDFGVDVPAVMDSLQHLDTLRRLSAREAVAAGG